MKANTDIASVRARDRSAALSSSGNCASSVRIIGADLLRLASLLSIVLLHVVLKDARFAAATSSPMVGTFDALISVSTVFDNRSMAVLSLFLLLMRHRDAPYHAVMAERTRRLLLPFLTWTLLYPFLDLAIASLTGQLQPSLARVLDMRFWLSGVFLATAKEHLHFLPALLILTLLLPVYRTRLPLWLVIVLLASTSAFRAGAEFFIVGDVYNSSVAGLAALSALRTVEYLPLGFLAFALAEEVQRVRRAGRFEISAMTVTVLVLLSVLLEPEQFIALGAATGRLTWSIAQAVLGTVAMALAAQGVLVGGGSEVREDGRFGILGRMFSERALALFLVHPFFCDVFDAIVMAPDAYGARMAVPKFAFVLLSSLFASSFLIKTRSLRWTV
jgi:Acyltransferase family